MSHVPLRRSAPLDAGACLASSAGPYTKETLLPKAVTPPSTLRALYSTGTTAGTSIYCPQHLM